MTASPATVRTGAGQPGRDKAAAVPATTRLEAVRRASRDERGGRVVFAWHCLLNQNVRYLGGATRPGGVDDLVGGWHAAGTPQADPLIRASS